MRALRSSRSAVAALALVAAMSLVALLAPVLASSRPGVKVGEPFAAPSGGHLLGLDDIGGDVLSTLMWAARASLVVGVAATLVSLVIGVAVGLVGGYAGGGVDTLLARATDFVLTIPVLPLMIVVAALYGSSTPTVIVIIGALSWPATARVVRAQVKTLRERAYVRRARTIGAGPVRIMITHILPQLGPLIAASTALTIGNAIFFEAALAFLGLTDPSHASWGQMIQNAFTRGATSQGAWWAIVPPGLAIGVAVIAVSMIGRALEDALNPRLGVSHVGTARFTVVEDATQC
jgi:peptide/nickel transport system permease protein